jgi:hypothetical protein
LKLFYVTHTPCVADTGGASAAFCARRSAIHCRTNVLDTTGAVSLGNSFGYSPASKCRHTVKWMLSYVSTRSAHDEWVAQLRLTIGTAREANALYDPPAVPTATPVEPMDYNMRGIINGYVQQGDLTEVVKELGNMGPGLVSLVDGKNVRDIMDGYVQKGDLTEVVKELGNMGRGLVSLVDGKNLTFTTDEEYQTGYQAIGAQGKLVVKQAETCLPFVDKSQVVVVWTKAEWDKRIVAKEPGSTARYRYYGFERLLQILNTLEPLRAPNTDVLFLLLEYKEPVKNGRDANKEPKCRLHDGLPSPLV